MQRNRKFTTTLLFLFTAGFLAAQPTFMLRFGSRGKVKTSYAGGSPDIDISNVVNGQFSVQCLKKDDQYILRFQTRSSSGEWQEGFDWDVVGRPMQYYPDNPDSYLYNLLNVSTESAKVIYVKGKYLMFVNSRGTGYIYYEEVAPDASSILKEAFDVIASDGITIYHYNHSADVGAWTSDLRSGDDQRLIFLAPEEGADYRISDTLNRRVYRFVKNQPYSSILLREKLGDAVHFSGDTITITRNYLHDRNDRIPKQFRYMWYYPDNVEMLAWNAECPTCTDPDWASWETGKGMLLFTCNDLARVKLTVRYRLIKPKDSNLKTDTIRVTKIVHDTVYLGAMPAPVVKDKERAVVEKESFTLKKRKLNIAVWDNAGVDGDIITLSLNGRVIISNLKLDHCHTNIDIELEPGENILVMRAENLGKSPPNTASFLFTAEGFKKSVVLRADMGYSESIRIVAE